MKWRHRLGRNRPAMRQGLLPGLALAFSLWWSGAHPAPAQGHVLASDKIRFELDMPSGAWRVTDLAGHVTWQPEKAVSSFGEISLREADRVMNLPLRPGSVERNGERELVLVCEPTEDPAVCTLRWRVRLEEDGNTLAFSWDPVGSAVVEQVRLFQETLGVTEEEQGAALVPVREGMLIPADRKVSFQHRFDTYDYEGCHMAMFGLLKGGACALITWEDPYVALDLKSSPTGEGQSNQRLTPSLQFGPSARSVRVHFLGSGDASTVAQAYRTVARRRGWWVGWDEKLKDHPERALLFGATNFKLWSMLTRRMNEPSSAEESVRVNWTFEEAAQVAEHLKHDLALDRVLFTLGGWIHRGYDNQHPDILPAAPECGGDAGLAECSRRVQALGYLFCLHDNYQDMYRDAPSWDEQYLMRRRNGSLAVGGRWAGGRAYLTCAPKALELAQRPQNLTAVRQLTGANAYFIDTTYAAGLQECFSADHPLTRPGDMHWKQALSDYARGLFGVFGSECGREWAIPHSDFFEGLSGVSGRHFHNEGLEAKLGAVPVPLFELVYHDAIAIHGKYGYDPQAAAGYVLDHMILGRPLHHHAVPGHLYWKTGRESDLKLRPKVLEAEAGPMRRLRMTYAWDVLEKPAADWRVFVHFTDPSGTIRFQNDYRPDQPTSQWPSGEVRQGPFDVRIPNDARGEYEVRMGLFEPGSLRRASLAGLTGHDHSYRVGTLHIQDDQVTFKPQPIQARRGHEEDPGLFVRGDGGWTDGMHSLDRFVKNTHEILSPLNALTARLPMTGFAFLTPDRTVRQSAFGEGPTLVRVTVNHGAMPYRTPTRWGGDVELPRWGFVIEAPSFVAFHARTWNGEEYADPPLFTIRAMDEAELDQSNEVRVFHGFGQATLRWAGKTHTIRRESVLEQENTEPLRNHREH